MAILLGAFLIQGLTPGPEMLTTKLPITFGMMWSLIIANIVAAMILLAWANQLQRIIFIPAHLVLPGITFFILIGSWTAGNNIGDWITLLVFGAIGLAMKKAGWPRAPLVLGFILGRIMENSLHISMQAYGMSWVFRPVCIAIAIAIVVTIFFAVRSHMRMRQDGMSAASDADAGDPRLSLGLSIAIFAVLGYAIAATYPWPPTVRLFPLAFSIPALILVIFAIYFDWRGLRTAPALTGVPDDGPGGLSAELMPTLHFMAWLCAVLLVTVLFGQHVALPLFAALYLVVWGKYSWPLALVYAAVILCVMVLLFDIMSPTLWYPGLLMQWW